MTVGSAIKKAALRADGSQMSEVFGSTDQKALEMADLCNEVAGDIADAYDWRTLTKIGVITGDGVTPAFPLFDDYSRMLNGSRIADPRNWFWTYAPFTDLNSWLAYTNSQQGMMIPGGWIILDGQFQFYPSPTDTAQIPYISKLLFIGSDAVEKQEATADDDVFKLDDRLLTLGLLWRWKAQKGMDYAEDLASYERLLAKLSMDDKGSRTINGRRTLPGYGLEYAYPWQLG